MSGAGFIVKRGLLRKLQLAKPEITRAELDAVRDVLMSRWLAEGKVTEQFEKVVAKYVGASHAVAVCNATVALELCLRAKEFTGDVFVPAFGHPATVRAIINAGATPVFIDVSVDTYVAEPNSLSMAFGKPSVTVSWGGRPLSYEEASKNVVEDAACSLGSIANGCKTGSIVTSCFSFHPRKIVTTGEGGMVTTNDVVLADRLRKMKFFGRGNYKLSDVNSSIGLAQMEHVEEIIDSRIKRAHIYNDLFSEVSNVVAPAEKNGARHTYQTYAVLLTEGNRNGIIAKLSEQGIETQVGAYALHKLFPDVKQAYTLTMSENLGRNLLALPMAYDVTEEDQHRVVDALKRELA